MLKMKDVRDLSLSFFLVVCSVILIISLIKVNSFFSSTFPQHVSSSEVKKMQNDIIPSFNIEIKNLNIKYRNGFLLYRGLINLISNSKKQDKKKDNKNNLVNYINCIFQGNSYIQIVFVDKDNFRITSIYLDRRDFTRVVDDKGIPIYFSFEGKKEITYEDFKTIKDYFPQWKLQRCNN